MMSLTTLAHAQDKGADQKKSSWFKLCFKDKVATPPAKGKESKPEVKNICLTQYESFNPKNGRVLVAAAIRQIEGQKNKQFMVIVPHGMLLPAGVRVQVDKNKQFALPYTICTPGGCTAEIPATDDIMKQIQTGKEMRIAVLTRVQKPIFFPVPLNGFETAMNGKPIDNKKYAELLGKLWDKIRERNQKIAGQNGAEKKSN
ncbi:MAG: invasion associated locus B family protein [Pseudomonadota bacterium]